VETKVICHFLELVVMNANCLVDPSVAIRLVLDIPEQLFGGQPRGVSFASEHAIHRERAFDVDLLRSCDG